MTVCLPLAPARCPYPTFLTPIIYTCSSDVNITCPCSVTRIYSNIVLRLGVDFVLPLSQEQQEQEEEQQPPPKSDRTILLQVRKLAPTG